MPLTVRKFNAQIKDPQSGQMVPAGLLSSDSLQAIETAETAAVAAVQQKGVETVASIPNDYTTLSGDVDDLKTQLNISDDEIFGYDRCSVSSNANNRELLDSGIYITNSGYKVQKFVVTPGQLYKIVSDYKFQFQTDNTVPTSGDPTRVGKTYGTGIFLLMVPTTATYLHVCTPTSNGTAAVYSVFSAIDAKTAGLQDGVSVFGDEIFELTELTYEATGSNRRMLASGSYTQDSAYWTRKFPVTPGTVYKITSDYRFQFQTDNTTPTDGTSTRIGVTYEQGVYVLPVPVTATYLMVSTPVSNSTAKVFSATSAIDEKTGRIWDVLIGCTDDLFETNKMSPVATSTKRELGTNGNYTTNTSYNVRRYAVIGGQIYKVVSDHRFQFQTENTIPTDGDSSRVGETYGVGTYLVRAPATASYLMVCTPATDGSGEAYETTIYDPIKVKTNTILSRNSLYATARGSVTEYYVGPDQTYTTINDALTAWASASYPDAVVYIANGEYNETVFVEDANISFIGESRDGVVIRTTTGLYNDAPFRIHHGNVLVANMTVIADHSDTPNMALDGTATTYAYAFHIDGGSVGGLVHIKNCTAISYQAPAFGMGTIPDATIRLEDCDAYCYTPSTAGATKNNDCILCHLSDPNLYSGVGNENLELINVNALTINTPQVLLIKLPGGQTKTLGLTAINTTLVKNAGGQISAGLANAVIGSLSIGNNDINLNYTAIT